jgi:uncharacterized RDD family membrane protein YckC
MARWTGTWLQGPGVTLSELRDPEGYFGKSLGLPREGTGSLATFSARLMGFLIDIVVCGLVAGLLNVFVEDPSAVVRQSAAIGVLALEHVVFVAAFGQTLGMRMLGLKVLRFRDVTRPPGAVCAATRTLVLLGSFGLTGFFTRHGRGLHDAVAGSAVVRA